MNKKETDKFNTRKFKFGEVPQCKFNKKKKLPSSLVIEVCLAHKGVGRNKFYCAFAGQNPQCKHYVPKHKWGRSLWEMAGDYLYK